jgi:transposase-like protein
MNIHKNARTTPRSRAQIVQRVLTQHERPAAVAAAVGVSERTVRKWLTRYAAAPDAGLGDRSCRPRRSPTACPSPKGHPIAGALSGRCQQAQITAW